MSNAYSAHPALASEQLQRAELAAKITTTNTTPITTTHNHHRRHNNAASGCSDSAGYCHSTPKKLKTAAKKSADKTSATNDVLGSTSNFTTAAAVAAVATTAKETLPTLPDRTSFDLNDINFDIDAMDADDEVEVAANTKDCVDCATSASITPAIATTAARSIDETDHLQHRFSRSALAQQQQQQCSRQLHSSSTNATAADTCTLSDGCASGLSSTISSPSPSTVSSPLSTPTRLAPHLHHSHQHCCQKSTSGGCSNAASPQHHHHHIHHHHHHASSASSAASASAGAGGCKKLQKFDPRLGPSPYRQLLPIALCILSFATVFSILIVYMDTTEIRHQQFRLNMSRDYELYNVAQDDPILIAFLREIHMRKYPMHFLKNARDTPNENNEYQRLNFSGVHHDELTPKMAHYVADLVGGKMNGAVIQSLPGTLGQLMTAPWLAETLNWAGIIVEPEPRRFFTLRKQNDHRSRLQLVHACVSPNPYPKEVTIHNEESDVRINSLLDEETSWFNSRVKCFPLYTIMMACARVEYDLLSLGVHGHELEILQTLPFDKVKIEVISIHLPDEHEDVRDYIQTITKFLIGKSYKLQKRFGRNYFYQHVNTTSRTRKKDILLLKTP